MDKQALMALLNEAFRESLDGGFAFIAHAVAPT
jgi:hypothetical protein